MAREERIEVGARAQPVGRGMAAVEPSPSPRALERLQSIADSTLSYLSLEDAMSELLERIRIALEADTAALLLLDEERKVLLARAARGLEEEVRQGVQVPLARGFAGRVAAQRRPIVIEDLSVADVVNPILRQKGIRSMLGVPVHVEGRVIGVMHIGTLSQRLFSDEEIALLQLAADRVALALDNARLAEQRAATELIQRTLLPAALPEVPGLRFSAKYLPAGSAVRIGGDWYDVFHLPDGRLTLVVGDVVGRGVLAASVMSEARTALRAYLSEGHTLPDVMALLNELMISMGRHRGATAAIFELDVESGALDAVSAGHLPAVLVAPSGRASLLSAPQGLPLGVRRAATFEAARFTLPTGATLLLYTDGLIERRTESIDVGLERLLDAAEGATHGDESSFADRVYRALTREAVLEDDLALLAIESLPLGPTLELTLEADPAVLAAMRRTLARWLRTCGLGEDGIFDVALAASEAAANAIEHAYGGREGSFRVSCSRGEQALQVLVADSGRWRTSKPRGRGRGLTIMRALVDEVSVEQGEEGTTITLTKRLAGS